MSLGLVSDVPTSVSDRHQFEAMLLNTEKPIVFTAHDYAGMMDILKMCEIVVGGEEELRTNPFIALYAEPITPLRHTQNAVQKLLLAAERSIPVVYTPCPMAGATAPVTLQTGSYEMIVMSDEIIGLVKQIIKGIEVTLETLAVELIHKVGPGGHFLAEEHTVKHLRSEHWYP